MVSQAQSITILMATYDGADFLEEQLQSLVDQRWERINVLASDDGSTDATLAILKDWQGRWSRGRFEIVRGPGAGFAENFRSLLCSSAFDADFVAFCDQDDVWGADKLCAAAARLGKVSPDCPALYSSRTEYISEDGVHLGYSPLFNGATSFRNAIVQNIGGGNTMVMNRAAFLLVGEGARRTGFVSHDWWSYLMVTGAGGRVIYDSVPRIAYRQHGGNLVGENTSIRAKIDRLKRMIAGQFSEWTERNTAGLNICADLLTPESRSILAAFTDAKRSGLIARIAAVVRLRLYRQTFTGNVGLYVQALIGRL